jgi:hypothetical protein
MQSLLLLKVEVRHCFLFLLPITETQRPWTGVVDIMISWTDRGHSYASRPPTNSHLRKVLPFSSRTYTFLPSRASRVKTDFLSTPNNAPQTCQVVQKAQEIRSSLDNNDSSYSIVIAAKTKQPLHYFLGSEIYEYRMH